MLNDFLLGKLCVLVSVTVMVVYFVGAGTNVLVEVNYRLD